jgi:hypothetical protein
MTEVTAKVYQDNFASIFSWFKQKVHRFDPHKYILTDLPDTHLKLIEIISDAGNVIFRVILKATFERLPDLATPDFDIRSIQYLQKTKSNYPVSPLAALNICYIQLSRWNNHPVNDLTYIFSNNRLMALERI